ncbi:MAG: hypothetical protein HY719_10760, partial [Planctomycetes bacterium]|nr:hypothetical protein [Planctomycetota bacterium]
MRFSFRPLLPLAAGAAALALALAVALLAAGAAFASNGLKPTFTGARAGARGGTDIALADTGNALNTNPAGLMNLSYLRLDTMAGLFTPNTEFISSWGKSR